MSTHYLLQQRQNQGFPDSGVDIVTWRRIQHIIARSRRCFECGMNMPEPNQRACSACRLEYAAAMHRRREAEDRHPRRLVG